MDLKPIIWISSINHLKKYEKIIKSTPFRKKFFYEYNMPDDFPKIKKQPLVYFSRGEVTLKNETLTYEAFDGKIGTHNVYNLKNHISFTLNRSSIETMAKYHFKNAFGRNQRHWIRITCDEAIMGGDFLICADNVGNTNRLFKMLKQLKEGQTPSTSLTDYSANKFVLIGYVGIILLYASLFIQIILKWGQVTIFGPLTGNIGNTIAITLFFLLYTLPWLLLFSFMIWAFKGLNEKVSNHFNIIFPGFMVGIALNSIILHYS